MGEQPGPQAQGDEVWICQACQDAKEDALQRIYQRLYLAGGGSLTHRRLLDRALIEYVKGARE